MSAERRTDPALSRNPKPPPSRRWSIHDFGAPFAARGFTDLARVKS
jgi:hypothetical protein